MKEFKSVQEACDYAVLKIVEQGVNALTERSIVYTVITKGNTVLLAGSLTLITKI